MNFAQLHEALRLEILRRIDRGTLSGTLLARQTGLNQAHISNYLHRRRMLSLKALDKVLGAVGLTLSNLTSPDAVQPGWGFRPDRSYDVAPLVSQACAIHEVVVPANEVIAEVRLPPGTLDSYPQRRSRSRREWQRFVAVRVTTAQAEAMRPVLYPRAVVVIDRHYTSLRPASGPGGRPGNAGDLALYAVRLMNGLAVRFVNRFEGGVLVLWTARQWDGPQVVRLGVGRPASDVVVGRVCRIENDL